MEYDDVPTSMPSRTLFDFSQPGNTDDPTAWQSIDDPVMGGVSESEFEPTGNGAVFTGTLSLKHGGGFASVRAPNSTYDLSEARGLEYRVRGDGKQYWLTIYTYDSGSVSYRASVRPPNRWSTVAVPFSSLTPYRRGTQVRDAPEFDPSTIRTLGVLISDAQEGPFRLEIAWIRPLTDSDQT